VALWTAIVDRAQGVCWGFVRVLASTFAVSGCPTNVGLASGNQMAAAGICLLPGNTLRAVLTRHQVQGLFLAGRLRRLAGLQLG
jgi:hypothetical protein